MNRAVYRHLLQTYGKRPAIWLGFLAETIRTLMLRVWIAIIMAQTVELIAMGNYEGAKENAFLFFSIYAAGSLIGMFGELISIRAENDVYDKQLVQYYEKLTNKDMAFYRDNQTGYLASLFRQYLDSGMWTVRFMRTDVISTIVGLSAPVAVLMYVDWHVGAITCAIVVAQLLYVLWSSAVTNKSRLASFEIYRKITGEVSDVITNIVAFKSGGIERETQSRIAALSKEEIATFWFRRKTTTILDLPRSIITAVGMAAAFYVIADNANMNANAVGLMVLTLSYIFQIIRNVSELPNLILRHDDWVTKLFPTLEYLQGSHETIKDPAQPKPLQITNGQIDLNHVHFSYPSRSANGKTIPVFTDLDLHISGGEQVGIVGLSGAGKSTLASLLMRFDDIQQGSITIDGINIRSVLQSDLRKSIAYVPQEPILFHRNVQDNIAFFNPTAQQSDVIAASQAAYAHDFITALPDGYQTIVGERGVKLSGGQKQRVVIARAVLKHAPIMIFDEATSALDSESEQIIQQALPKIIGKQTAIVIAHRLSTVAGLDRIIVMQDGSIAEQGTHRELLNQRGRYYALWQKQLGEQS